MFSGIVRAQEQRHPLDQLESVTASSRRTRRTAYSPDEIYAAGHLVGVDYVGEGLPRWVQANREIANRDVVVCYTLGVTHLPRPEDWPIMPAHRAGFGLIPFGFFTQNPAMDVSRPHPWK